MAATPAEGLAESRAGIPVPGMQGRSQPWLVNVGGSKETTLGWFIQGAEEFLDRAVSVTIVAGGANGPVRAKQLLALPLVGTGGGGGAEHAGQIAAQLLPALERKATEHDVDVALVLRDTRAFAAVQAARRRSHTSGFHELGDDLQAEARRLAALVNSGELVLFLGAGLGVAAGLPDWTGLLGELARKAGLSEEQCVDLRELDPLDRAQLIARRLEGEGRLGQAIHDIFRSTRHHALAHALLASLPVAEIVTTNYDTLFETASEAIGQPVRVVPFDLGRDQRRWLLKMHGSVSHPESVVLTRQDYLRYAEHWGALAGIVQALLITRHMLFVGFG